MTAPSIIDSMNDPALFGPSFSGATWSGWRTILKAAYALPMTDAERAFFQIIAEREPPGHPVRELWIIAGRRAGKDSIASVIAAHTASMFEDQGRLRRGERAMVACLAVDRDQSKIVLGYTKAYFADIELLHDLVVTETRDGLELNNGVDVVIATNNFRSVRGRAVLCAILDECAFYRDEASANPDLEVYNALRPGLASLPGSLLIGISTPYAKTGLLYKKFCDHFGKNSPDVLVIKAPTPLLNPTIDQAIIDAAMADDPAAARAEWMAEFRDDIAAFVSRETIAACTVAGRYEQPPIAGLHYSAFCDPSGGSADSMTLAICHRDKWSEKAVLDAVREIRPPFSPEAVVSEFCGLLRRYGITSVRGDRYAGEWPRERFKLAGISYIVSDRTKNDIYRDVLPLLNSGQTELLDLPRLQSQFASLERRTARGGKDSIDHPPGQGQRDDVANAVAGAIVYSGQRGTPALLIGVESGRRSTLDNNTAWLQ